jgi:hypothetical protein
MHSLVILKNKQIIKLNIKQLLNKMREREKK